MRFLKNQNGKEGQWILNWENGALEELILFWNPQWYHLGPPFPFFCLLSLGDSGELSSDISSTLPVTLFFAFPGAYKAGIPSPLACLSRAIYVLSSIFSWSKTLPFPGFTRNGIPQKTFITILRGLLETVNCVGKFHIVKHLRPCSFASSSTPHSLLPASLNSSFQTLPDLMRPLGGMVQFTSYRE